MRVFYLRAPEKGYCWTFCKTSFPIQTLIPTHSTLAKTNRGRWQSRWYWYGRTGTNRAKLNIKISPNIKILPSQSSKSRQANHQNLSKYHILPSQISKSENIFSEINISYGFVLFQATIKVHSVLKCHLCSTQYFFYQKYWEAEMQKRLE